MAVIDTASFIHESVRIELVEMCADSCASTGSARTDVLFNSCRINSVEQIAEDALSLPSEARALLADRLVESLDPAEDGYMRQLWMQEARRRIDEVRSGNVATIPGEAAFAQVRAVVGR